MPDNLTELRAMAERNLAGLPVWKTDLSSVLEAFLRLTDPTPLTKDVLRASGGALAGGSWRLPSTEFTLTSKTCDGERFFLVEAFPFEIGTVDTVGDLRRLLSGLNIDCDIVVKGT